MSRAHGSQRPTGGGYPSPVDRHPSGLAPVVERNIRALLERRREEIEEQGTQERIAAAVTRFAGSMTFVYLHAAIFGLWIAINLGAVPGVPRFDPTLVVLAMVASVEAIFLSTFVLITQNRMAAQAERRAELDLQISLLAEHEITQIITMVTAMARKMDIAEAHNPELPELEQNIAPEKVMDEIEEEEERVDDEPVRHRKWRR